MKVILRKDIPKIGRRGEVKEVHDGYARNFLIPQSLAEIATPEALASLEKIKKVSLIEKEVAHDLLVKNLKQLGGVTLVIRRSANEKGHLFSAIRPNDITDALKKEHRIELAPENLLIGEPIKETGTFSINIGIGDAKGILVLIVENDKKAKK